MCKVAPSAVPARAQGVVKQSVCEPLPASQSRGT